MDTNEESAAVSACLLDPVHKNDLDYREAECSSALSIETNHDEDVFYGSSATQELMIAVKSVSLTINGWGNGSVWGWRSARVLVTALVDNVNWLGWVLEGI
jgi:hypothetical protein